MSKKDKIVCTTLGSAITGCISIFAFASLVFW